MYKSHNIWDEDKWDIHSSGTGYLARGPEQKKELEHYHKNAMYGSSPEGADKISGDYRSAHHEEDNKKKDQKEEKEKTIVDAVEQEEKYRKNDAHGDSNPIAAGFQQHHFEGNDKTELKKKNHRSIEDAINNAVKEEKATIFVD